MSQFIETYNGWHIQIQQQNDMYSKFCFEVTSPEGVKHKVPLGGDTEQRAFERARELIDLESQFSEDE